ncbi:hypothetical protein QBC36DRAFT_309940 [Triangularia setosa]|uniref:Uncharacterized protein n=1 Tax=Triangularia setosa TaxID=2587417 RepID=A0AAN6W925_9PEZI|nr:hypothetical protein QBC36DRAFT_309940 [Podospora setosa]
MWTRASAVRSSLRIACRRPTPTQLARPLARRGYVSAQGSAARSSDAPWQFFAVGITVPGVFFLYKPSKPAHSGHGSHDEDSDGGGHEGSSEEHQAAETKSENKDSDPDSSSSSSSSDNSDEGCPTPSSSGGSDGPSKEVDDSAESQAQKLHGKQASQRVAPAENNCQITTSNLAATTPVRLNSAGAQEYSEWKTSQQVLQTMARSSVQPRPDDWQAGLCEPGKGGICPRSCFLGFDQFGRNNYRLNRVANNDDPLDMKKYKECNEQCWNCFLLCPFTLCIGSGVYVGRQTHHVRKTYGIQGKYSDDIAQGIFCQPCSLIRNELEVRKREKLRDNIMQMQAAPMPLGENRFQPMYTMPVHDTYRSEPQMMASHIHQDENDEGQRVVPLFPRDQLPQIPSVGSPFDPFARRGQILTPITERDSSEDPRQQQRENGGLGGGVGSWLQQQKQGNGKVDKYCMDDCKPKKGRKGRKKGRKEKKKEILALPGKAHAICANCGGKKKVVIFPVDERREQPGFEEATVLVQRATSVLAEIDRNSPNLAMVEVQPGDMFVSEPPAPARLRQATVTDHRISADVQIPRTIHSPRSHSLSIDIRVPDGRGSLQRHTIGYDPRVVQLVIEPRDQPIEADISVQEMLSGEQQHSISVDPKIGEREEGPRGHGLKEDEVDEQILEEGEGKAEMAEGKHGSEEDVKADVSGEGLKKLQTGEDERVDTPVGLAREHSLARDSRVPTPTLRAFAHGIHLDEKVPAPELQRLNAQHSLSQDRKVLTPSPGREYVEHDLHADDRVKSPALFPVRGHEMGDDVRVESSWAEGKEHGIGEDERVDSPVSSIRAPEHLLREDAKVSQRAHRLLEHFLEEDRKVSRGSSRGFNQKENGK